MDKAVKCQHCGKAQFTIEKQELCIYCDEPLFKINNDFFSNFSDIFGGFNENNKKNGK